MVNTLERSWPARPAFFAGLLSIAALIFVIELPPVQDYPNHLARYWLISGGADVAPTSAMFAVDWRNASTNIGADLLIAALALVLPYWVAGKLLLLAAFAGPPAAAAWLNRILFGRWSWWSLSFLLLAWTTTSIFGFLNYQLSLAAALLFACLDALARLPAGLKFVARVVFASAVLMIHPFGLIFLVLLLVALTIGPAWSELMGRRRLLQIARSAIWPILAAIVPVAILMVLAPHPPGEHHNSAQAIFMRAGLSPARLFLTAASPLLTYRAWVDLLFFAPVLAAYLYALVARKARTHAGMLTIGLLTALISLGMPEKIGDAEVVDRRLPLMAAFLLLAGALPEPFAKSSSRDAAAGAMLAIVLARTLWIGSVWWAREADVWAVKSALKDVPAGAAVLTVQSEPADVASEPIGRLLAAEPPFRYASTLEHVPVMAIPWRKAFVPTLFAVPGQQPVRVIPPWTELKSASTAIPDVHVLDEQPAADIPAEFSYLRDWTTKFDYVIAIRMDHDDFQGPFVPPRQLSLVADEGFARLYRVQR